jgi:hypothetical protein
MRSGPDLTRQRNDLAVRRDGVWRNDVRNRIVARIARSGRTRCLVAEGAAAKARQSSAKSRRQSSGSSGMTGARLSAIGGCCACRRQSAPPSARGNSQPPRGCGCAASRASIGRRFRRGGKQGDGGTNGRKGRPILRHPRPLRRCFQSARRHIPGMSVLLCSSG